MTEPRECQKCRFVVMGTCPTCEEDKPLREKRNLEEDKKWLESVFGHYVSPLDFSETDVIAMHALDRAIAAENKLAIVVRALEEIMSINYVDGRPSPEQSLAIQAHAQIRRLSHE